MGLWRDTVLILQISTNLAKETHVRDKDDDNKEKHGFHASRKYVLFVKIF